MCLKKHQNIFWFRKLPSLMTLSFFAIILYSFPSVESPSKPPIQDMSFPRNFLFHISKKRLP